jgi:radical SAM-linked protein
MRIRITFSKTGPLIYIGNLDLLTIWERAARRAGLALAYSHGFHPQPKIHLAAPLPLGLSSRNEILDMRLDEDVDCADTAQRLQAAVPEGIRVLDLEPVDEAAPALQAEVQAAEYEITLDDSIDAVEVQRGIDRLLSAASLPRERRGKVYDLRPLISDVRLTSDPQHPLPKIWMRLSSREGATGRPDEVLAAMGIERTGAEIERTALIFRA